MAFPASTITLDKAWSDFRRAALRAKHLTQNLRDESAAGVTTRERYYNLRQNLNDSLNEWAALLASTTGLQAYARDQLEDQALDLSAEYVAMRDAVTSLRDWIDANIPTDAGSGAVLLREPDGTLLTFTTAQTSGFRTQADAVILAID